MGGTGVVLVVDPSPAGRATADRLERDLDDLEAVTAETIPAATAVLESRRVECVVSAYEVPDDDGVSLRGGEKLLGRVRAHDPDIPFVLYTEVGNGAIARSVVGRGVADFIRRDGTAASLDHLVARVEAVVEHRRVKRRASWQHRVTETIREVNQALVRASTREAIEANVCERLVGADLYGVAALGDCEDGEFVSRERAGSSERRDDGGRPLGVADLLTATPDDVRVRRAPEAGGTHVAVVPVAYDDESYDDTAYGALVVTSTRPDAFDGTERRILGELGETVAHAIRAVETRSRLERRERELARQNERLQHFASMVSHDLRNPLQVVIGRLALIEPAIDEDHFRSMETALDRMSALIEDVLSLATGGTEVVDADPVDLASVARASWDVDARAGDLVVDDPGTIVADESLLGQLLGNLFSNAVEHVGEDVTVRLEAVQGGFAVVDDGPGVPDEETEWLFEMGYSGDGAGTGYGLAIVAEVADAHGWDVDVSNEDGDRDAPGTGGARFEITGVEFAE